MLAVNNFQIVAPGATLVTPVSWIESYPRLLEVIGRTCYKSEDKITPTTAGEFIRRIIKSGHESVIEHMCITARIICSRDCSHQLVRHRIASYCIDGEAVTELTLQGGYARRTIRQLYEMKKTSHGRSRLKLVMINCVDLLTGEVVRGRVKDVIFSGKKACVEIETAEGYKVKATKEHRFWTRDGWKPLGEILEKDLEIAINGKPWVSKDVLVDLYLVERKTRSQISNQLGVDLCFVDWMLSKYGIYKNRNHKYREKITSFPDVSWVKREYLEKNRSQESISRELGVSISWLYDNVIKPNNLQKPHPNRPGRKPGRGKKGMFSDESKKRISERMRGSNNPSWRGGISLGKDDVRSRITKELRKKVYEKDDYTCRMCSNRGGKLSLHHIIPIWQAPDKVDCLSNLVTLCVSCHRKLNNKEHLFQDMFENLEPIKPHSRSRKKMLRKNIEFVKVVRWREAGEIDTYDVEMLEPNHNFVANGFVVHNSQESQRFVDYQKKPFSLIVCPSFFKDLGVLEELSGPVVREYSGDRGRWNFAGRWFDVDSAFSDWANSVAYSYATYLRLRGKGIPAEDARSVLPNSAKTEVVSTFNLRQWRHVFRERALNKHAQWQIKQIFQGLLELFDFHLPQVFGDLASLLNSSEKISQRNNDVGNSAIRRNK